VPVNCTYLKFGFQWFYNIPFLEYVPAFQFFSHHHHVHEGLGVFPVPFFSQNDKFSHPKAISIIFNHLHVHNIPTPTKENVVIPLHHIQFFLAFIINQNVCSSF
jgi:hypothetical protein